MPSSSRLASERALRRLGPAPQPVDPASSELLQRAQAAASSRERGRLPQQRLTAAIVAVPRQLADPATPPRPGLGLGAEELAWAAAGIGASPSQALGQADGAPAPAVLRFIYRGETAKNGRVVRLPERAVRGELHEATGERVDVVSGRELLAALRTPDANADLNRFMPFYYTKALEGWERLRAGSEVVLLASSSAGSAVRRVEVILEQRAVGTKDDVAARRAHAARRPLASTAVATVAEHGDVSDAAADGGYFGIGVYNSKSADNVGTLWRSAFQLGSSFIFTIGGRNEWEKKADTYKAWRQMPAYRYESWGDFCCVAPFAAQLVAVEMGGTPLEGFVHPDRAVYLLGAEDAGLPANVRLACSSCVCLSGVRAENYNVAVAGSIVLYDRLRKRQTVAAAEGGDGGSDQGSGKGGRGRGAASAAPVAAAAEGQLGASLAAMARTVDAKSQDAASRLGGVALQTVLNLDQGHLR